MADKIKYQYGFHKPENYVFKSKKGLSEEIVKEISRQKHEPDWMIKFRLEALKIYHSKPLPSWGQNLGEIDFDDLYYYLKPIEKKAASWDELPKEIKETYEKIGIPEAERKFLGGVSAQYESEVVYKSIKKTLAKKGVIFLDMDSGLRDYPQIVKKYFGKIVPSTDNKFAALNSAVWSGGSFIYVPKEVKVELPLQAYFRINAEKMGQFERTLIIADEGSFIHYVEGCTAPIYSTDSLHAAVVEIIVEKGARVRYTTIQNWSKNVYNLVTKRMEVKEDGIGEWVDGNLGSKLTMKYPSLYLTGKRARGEILSIAYAGRGQCQDAGGKAVHLAAYTSSKITSKSISVGGGKTVFRGLVKMYPEAVGSRTKTVCNTLIVGKESKSETYPTMDVRLSDVIAEHEATVSKISEEQLFYLNSRGIEKSEAEALIVNGFIEPIVKELPLEYAVELNRLIQMEMKENA